MVTVYATLEDIESGFRTLTTEEETACTALLEEAAIIIDSMARNAPVDAKKVVSCRMIRRVIAGMSSQSVPMGAIQGTVTAGPYSQTWNYGSGASSGELYLSKTDKLMLGIGDKLGSRSPLEQFVCDCGNGGK